MMSPIGSETSTRVRTVLPVAASTGFRRFLSKISLGRTPKMMGLPTKGSSVPAGAGGAETVKLPPSTIY